MIIANVILIPDMLECGYTFLDIKKDMGEDIS